MFPHISGFLIFDELTGQMAYTLCSLCYDRSQVVLFAQVYFVDLLIFISLQAFTLHFKI